MADGVSARLLHYLRGTLGRDGLDYRAEPERLSGGNETFVYSFELADAPGPFSGPLVLRVFRDGEPDRARFEAAVQNALADVGYPAPRAPLAEDDPSHVGGAFVLMEKMPGRMLGETIYELSEQGSVRPSLGAGVRYFHVLRMLAKEHARLHAIDPEPMARALASIGRAREVQGFEARIESARRVTEESRLEGLRPGLDWLEARRPPPASRPSVCHGDFVPNNLLVEGDTVRGVIDWSFATIADPALDVACQKVAFETVPASFPRGLRAPGSMVQRAFSAQYLRYYERHRRVDRAALQYFEALRCLEILACRGANRRAGREVPDAWDAPGGESKLLAHVRKRTGLSLEMPR